MSISRPTAAAVVLLAVAAATAQDKKAVPNPDYAGWAKLPVGTRLTTRSTSGLGKSATAFWVNYKLVEVTDAKVVVETTLGKPPEPGALGQTGPPTRRDVPKTIEVPAAAAAALAAGKPPGDFTEGTETLTVGGVPYKAKWFKFAVGAGAVKSEQQVWLSDDLPPSVPLKVVSKGGPVEQVTELVAVKKP